MKTREEFSVFTDGKQFFRVQNQHNTLNEYKLAVQRPNHKQQTEAELVYARYMNKYLKEGIMPTDALQDTIINNGIWSQEKVDKEDALIKKMTEVATKLAKSKIKVSEGIKLAKDGIRARGEWMFLTAQKSAILNNAADALARNHRFNYLTSVCSIKVEDGQPVFDSYDNFLTKDANGDFLPTRCGEALAKLLYNMEDDFRKDWPEYQFLLKFKQVNEKLDFIDKDGNVVDIDGNKILPFVPVEENVGEPEFYEDDEVAGTSNTAAELVVSP